MFELTDPDLRDEVLSKTELVDVWGINKRTAVRLENLGIHSAKDFRDMDIRVARKALTVVGSRIVEELRGFPSLSLEMVTPRKKSIVCSRSFAGEVKTLTEMTESVINFVSTATEKMRRQELVTNGIQVFIHTNLFKEKGLYSNSGTLKVTPTDSTRELIASALRILRSVFRPGYGYRKSGVILLGLQPREGETQRLFEDGQYLKDRSLMESLDSINGKFGRHAVRFGWPIKREKNWHMNRNYLSPRFTTNFVDILRVR